MLVEMLYCDPGMTFQKPTLSQIIMNSKSKECGPLRLHFDDKRRLDLHRVILEAHILCFLSS